MFKKGKAKEVEINFGAARAFVQYGLADAVADLNHPNLRGENDPISETDQRLLDWNEDFFKDVPISDHHHDVKIRIEFEPRTSRKDRLAIGDLIIKHAAKKTPGFPLTSPYIEDHRAEDIFYINQGYLLKQHEAETVANGCLEGVLEARAKWWETQREQDPKTSERAAVAKAIATIMNDYASKLSPLKRLKAEDIIVDRLGPAMFATQREGVSKQNMAAGLAFYLDDTKREADKVTVQLGVIGISEPLSRAIKHEVGRNIFPTTA